MHQNFDPDGALVGGGIYGLPHSPEEAGVVLIPVPWEATVSYGAGTARGPEAILAASHQLDLMDRDVGQPYEHGVAMLPIPRELVSANQQARTLAMQVIEQGGPGDRPGLQTAAKRVNALCEEMNAWVYQQAKHWLDQGKRVGVVGGDHSTPFGLIRALAERTPGLGILHVDAHADLRDAYEGFTWSHASIMYNVVHRLPQVVRLVQVGIRDYGRSEDALIRNESQKIRTFFDSDLRSRLHDGESWGTLAGKMVSELPDAVYVSFDIDGLDPKLCPNTGTPVPGGLSFPEAVTLLKKLVESGRRIVGFDLNEVAPDPSGASEWDANVGARVLYKLIGFMVRTAK